MSIIEKSGIGCHVGTMFVGILAYADDIVLLAPTSRAMRRMLALCDKYADEFSILFNAKKSKCLIIKPYGTKTKMSSESNPLFYVGGSEIEIVDHWPHLGHIISKNCDDKDDIMNRRNCLVGQINNVLSYFGNLNSVTKYKLLASYCSSLYGCEIWRLDHSNINDVCVAWRKGLRRVWNLPADTHCELLPLICDTIPLFDVICSRAIMFINSCLNSTCPIVNYISRFGVYYGRMLSPIGQNAHTCCVRYGVSTPSMCGSLNTCIIKRHFQSRVSDSTRSVVNLLLELLFIKQGSFYTGLSTDEIDELIAHLCRF